MMDANGNKSNRPPSTSRAQRLAIWEIMVLIAGAAVGIWILPPPLDSNGPGEPHPWVVIWIFFLGGLSLVGPPLLLLDWRRRGRWHAGRVLWFTQGMAAWLLWPPVVYRKIVSSGQPNNPPGIGYSGICFLYGTPLMAIYVTSALLAGGWIRRRARRRSWRETFGLILAALWACTGFYVLSLFYREDFGR
jgi:polyferredoxin